MDVKNKFPIFEQYANLVYLDNAATTQRPKEVISAVSRIYKTMNANANRAEYALSQKATQVIEETRQTIATFINAKTKEEIIFTKNTTESINNLANGIHFEKDDEIVITEMEHHSNYLPWRILANKNNLKLIIIPYAKKNDNISEYITNKTKIVSFSAMSNLTGYIPDIQNNITQIRTKNKDCIIILDACQYIAHHPIDVQALDIDFLVFSMHKLYGPFGVGIVFGKKKQLELLEPHMVGGGIVSQITNDEIIWNNIPQRFESGTQDVASIGASKEAISFINEITYTTVIQHEKELTEYALSKLKEIQDIQIIGHDTENYGPVISFTHNNISSFDIASFLANHSICLRAGKHCAHPLCTALNITGTARISFSIYNTKEDIDILISHLKETIAVFERRVK